MPTLNSAVLVVALAAAVSTAASAAETSYRYDSLGRLMRSDQTASGQPHTVKFTYDAGGNRRTQIVENSLNGPATAVIVTPLGSGFAVIPIDRQQ